MAKPPRRTAPVSAAEATVDAQVPLAEPISSRDCARVQLIDQSGQGLSTQTQSLLRVRLRAAALVVFLGSAAFLVRNLLAGDMRGITDPELLRSYHWQLLFHLIHVAVLGLATGLLWNRCRRMSLRQLRLAELVIFGWTAAFFLRVQHFNTLYAATVLDSLPSPVGMWFALIFTYAIFIPNSWRRAALVIGLLAAAPLVWRMFEISGYPVIARVAATHADWSALVLMMLVGFGSSVYGTHVIGALRKEAYEARQLGQYRLRHLIGSGGMGEVYLAEHQLLKRPCAIKLIRPGKANDPTAMARFEREVRATARLSHWNTVEVFDYGRTDDGTFYYVMEYLPGLSLAELVEHYGPMPAERVVYLLRQACDALREAHSIGLIHRDIKPGNIFAAQRGGVYDVVKLLDFGLAKPLEGGAISLTQDGALTGSPLYMSPEQALAEQEANARSDIYSLGAVAYFLLTARPPFEGEKPIKVLLAHARDEVVPPSRLRPDVPADLEQIVLRCLEKLPEDRFRDVTVLGQMLAGCTSAGMWSRERAAAWWGETKRVLVEAAG